jgi:hypothetical protein
MTDLNTHLYGFLAFVVFAILATIGVAVTLVTDLIRRED